MTIEAIIILIVVAIGVAMAWLAREAHKSDMLEMKAREEVLRQRSARQQALIQANRYIFDFMKNTAIGQHSSKKLADHLDTLINGLLAAKPTSEDN